MSISYIPESVKLRLWGKSGGRCQYEGCSKPLWMDDLTKAEFNTAYIAHIIADKPMGPRGHSDLSKKLKSDISNLMLMCDEHHRLIDKIDVEGHPAKRLQAMKARHEARIELLTSLQENKRSHVLIYGANIGEQNPSLSWQKAAQAMIPLRYPAEPRAIELGLRNSSFEDHSAEYWAIERQNLRCNLNSSLRPRIVSGEVEHLSIFALAPQPLLIELGWLLSDIPAAEVYQLHREPPDWKWQESPGSFEFLIKEPSEIYPTVALNLSLSANIDNERILAVFSGKNVSIWRMSIEAPNNDFLKSREQLKLVRQQFRRLFDRIKTCHGQDALLHVFPAVPVSVAVELGRVWMPKADLPLCIYDQNRKVGGFEKTFSFEDDYNRKEG
ncbi:conserved hypothetical protein [uncultured Desulfobacterium sp.]|uniref:SMODS-associated and fused to various effectors domain-containing protein n=1 Tax=uncultured Desulfobacterium sp. TaxID=201089 RepID=A0A445MT16_9BACT|nr:conserved hypothetical protein [uncultured Desulfobacterium sp.]